ncbi:MAG: ABC transporter substrate-binding protein [Elusimicrobiaceae bacterium]|jgi:iron complex transport system substrate-binding protein|nr:ABC transporter substrate-binding protein [Elusimicrobiaceae bacterium]MBT3954921.1 ABC transporter substrate-binding protein [Elusimicrobiaceae bacterium]MBT4008571.1 ABC transporter substrate-binding protein [Elusimicrobiaceae bacterium]MBT4402991.1 ABC transporter substrate-binding protein [Elusimicrobiaceae bacterium]MBT4439737.1 ABC transporter substrate-binding protein [Elusimicrobiaceae bacterium]
MKKLIILVLILLFVVGGFFVFKNKNKKTAENSAQNFRSGGIISLIPVSTEILFAVGAENINGVSSYCNFPEEAENLPKYGDAFTANIEQIVSTKPEFVFVGQSAINPAQERLTNYGINVVYVKNAKNIEDIYRNISLIGNLVQKQKNASNIVEEIKNSVELAKNNVPQTKPKIFVELSSGLWTIGKQSYIDQVIEIAGGTNIFGETEQEYFKTNWETIYNKNPDIIISLSGADYKQYPLSDKINAIKNKKVITNFDADTLVRPGPRIKDAIKNLNEIFNEIFNEPKI